MLFDESQAKFFNDAEFLFFSGIMIYIGEWYFGLENVVPATMSLQKAMNSDPENTLFTWGYYSTIDQRPTQNTDLKLRLSEELLFGDSCYLNWLKNKGLLGEYVVGTLEGTYESLKNQKYR